MNRFKKTKGAVSIFLVIILVPMMTVSALFVDASKVSLAKSVSESAGDLTLNTALTDYDTKLKDMYGLFCDCTEYRRIVCKFGGLLSFLHYFFGCQQRRCRFLCGSNYGSAWFGW